jgi:hypothetical protein
MEDYKTALLEIALERPGAAAAVVTPITTPFLFLAELFTTIATLPIRREGTERLMDTLFANPSFAPLLTEASQADMQIAIDVTKRSVAFQNYWTYIILPAWDHHATLKDAKALPD